MTDPIIRVSDVAFPRFRAPDLDGWRRSSTPSACTARRAPTTRSTCAAPTPTITCTSPTWASRPSSASPSEADPRRPRHAGRGRRRARSSRSTSPAAARWCACATRTAAGRRRARHRRARAAAAARASAAQHRRRPRRVGTLQRVPTGPVAGEALRPRRAQDAVARHPRRAGTADTSACWSPTTSTSRSPDEPLGRFVRCDRGDLPADHHTLLLLETGEAKLGHVAWEVADFDDLMVGHDHLAADGAPALLGHRPPRPRRADLRLLEGPARLHRRALDRQRPARRRHAGRRRITCSSRSTSGGPTAAAGSGLLMDLGHRAAGSAIVCAPSKGLGKACALVAGARGRRRRHQRARPATRSRRRRPRSAPRPASRVPTRRRRHRASATRHALLDGLPGARHPGQQQRRPAARAASRTGTATPGSRRSRPTCWRRS